jgi:hypothetical protein
MITHVTSVTLETTDHEEFDLLTGRNTADIDSPVRPAPKWRRVLGFVMACAALAMVPWIVSLATSLPATAAVGAWDTVWVAFDCAILAGFAASGWLLWRHSAAAVVPLIVTATLLTLDAWFDICMSLRTAGQSTALLTSLLGNVPLILLMGWAAAAIMRRNSDVMSRLRRYEAEYGALV